MNEQDTCTPWKYTDYFIGILIKALSENVLNYLRETLSNKELKELLYVESLKERIRESTGNKTLADILTDKELKILRSFKLPEIPHSVYSPEELEQKLQKEIQDKKDREEYLRWKLQREQERKEIQDTRKLQEEQAQKEKQDTTNLEEQNSLGQDSLLDYNIEQDTTKPKKKNIIELYNPEDYKELTPTIAYSTKEYLDTLHKDSNSYITIANDTDTFTSKGYTYKEIVENNLLNTGNLIISMNTFNNKYSRKHNLQELKALYVDLNIHNKNEEEKFKEHILKALNDIYIDKKIPLPTYIISTGNGLRLEFLLNNTPGTLLIYWQELQEHLYNTLKLLGADKNSIKYTVINRPSGTINPKNNKLVTLYKHNDVRYDLEELYRTYIYNDGFMFRKLYKAINNTTNLPAPLNHTPDPTKARKIVPLLEKRYYKDPIKYLKLLHKDTMSGYTCIWSKDEKWEPKTYTDKTGKQVTVRFKFFNNKELLTKNLRNKDMFITLNTFNNTKRRAETLHNIGALYVDLDIYKGRYNKEQTIAMLVNEYFDKTIPTPSIVIDSGGGLYLQWLLIPVTTDMIPLEEARFYFNKLEDYLIDKLSNLASDTVVRDTSRVLRIPGSFNSKYANNPEVQIVAHTGYEYSLKTLVQEYIPEHLNRDPSEDMQILLGQEMLEEIKVKAPAIEDKIRNLSAFATIEDYKALLGITTQNTSENPMEDSQVDFLKDTEEEKREKRKYRHGITSFGTPIVFKLPTTAIEKTNKHNETYKIEMHMIKGVDKKTVKNDYATRMLCGQRVHDIELLCRKRKCQLIHYRHTILTLHLTHALFYYGNVKKAVARTTHLYNIITKFDKSGDPYTQDEFDINIGLVQRDFIDEDTAIKFYSNKTIVRMLDLTDEECKETDKLYNLSEEEMKALNKAELDINSKEYVPHMLQLLTEEEHRLRDNRSRMRTHEREQAEKPNKISVEARLEIVLALTKQSKPQKYIADIFKVHVKTIQRDQASLRDRGLLPDPKLKTKKIS